MTRQQHFHGILPALSTICQKNGDIDEEGQRRVVSFNIEHGVHGLVALVMNGDFHKFSDTERNKVAGIVVDEANGRVPVLIGTTHTGTTPTIQMSRYAQDVGADGVVILPPFFNAKESTIALYNHYASVARAIDIPIMVQDAEETTGVPVSSLLVVRLREKHDNVRYLKTEGSMALPKMSEVSKLSKGRVELFGGYFGYSLIEELEAGAKGTVPACGIPELCVKAYEEYMNGRIKKAKSELAKFAPYLDFNLLNVLSFPQIDLEVLKMRGVIKSAYQREPRVTLGEEAISTLRNHLMRLGLPELGSKKLS